MNYLEILNNQILRYNIRRNRLNYAKVNIDCIKKECQLKGLPPEELREARRYWKRWGVKHFNPDWIDYYSTVDGSFNLKYIPDDIFYTKIDNYLSDPTKCKSLDDKNMYDLMFAGTKMPETILRQINRTFLDKSYHALTLEEALQLCMDYGKPIIFKPSILSVGGYNIFFWEKQDGIDALKEYFKKQPDFIGQEIIRQHESLSYLHESSLNTIRIMTLFFDNKLHFLSTVVRIGVNGSRVDNVSSGGMACGLTSSGKLKKYAFYGNGEKIERHPQGAVFEGHTIVNYDKCVDEIKLLATRILNCTRLVSWDFSIGEDGEPILIEANMSFGGVIVHQICNGPVFGEMTDDVLTEVLISNRQSFFKKLKGLLFR